MHLNQKKRSALIFFFTLCLLCHVNTGISAKQNPIVYSQSGVTNISKNACELQTRWNAIPTSSSRFLENPSVCSPYSPGVLSESIIEQGVSYVNFIRYAAGLPLVVANDQDNDSAQHGAMLLAASNTLSHTPTRPADMKQALYQTCLQALSQSNIACVKFPNGATVAQEKIMPMAIQSYMNAQGASNRKNVGHRRWILNPDLCSVGIGCADANTTTEYQVLKIFDTRNSSKNTPDYQFIAWPSSGAFPTQAIGCKNPWSISLNPEIFKIPSRDDLTITITRDDGKCWTLNRKSATDSGQEEFLLVDTKAYGIANCIIFAFAIGQNSELSGNYHVTVSGLTTVSGREAILDYTTSFVDVEQGGHTWVNITDIPATCTKAGSLYRICTECGIAESKTLEALGHNWKQTELLRPSEKYVEGKAEFICTRCNAQKTDVLPLLPCDPATCPTNQFTDMPPATNWAHNGIDFVIENKLFTGINATTFAPKSFMTRAMIITVLWRMAGMPQCTDTAVKFSDVADGQYYTQAIKWGVSNGIVSGVSANCFAPETVVTREQTVTFLYRFYGSKKSAVSGITLSDFADSDNLHSYAQSAMLWAVQNEILSGNAQQCLCPQDNITREQAATIIMRCLNKTD